MKNSYKSCPKSLISYLMNDQGNGHRVLHFSITNCLGLEADGHKEAMKEEVFLAATQMVATQCMNDTAKSAKMYHLLVSFKDEPAKATLREIERELCDALGFTEHERVSVLHGDSDNVHLHIAINKIHPRTYNIRNPYHDHTILAKECVRLEKKFGIQMDNHEFKTEARPSRATAMEKAGDMESLIGWMQRNCKETLKNANTWEDFHKVLASRNLKIQERGNGFIFTDGNVHVKASSVDRSFSKHRLEERLGKFVSLEAQVPVLKEYKPKPMCHGHRTDFLYEQFQRERRESNTNRKKELEDLFIQEKAEIKELFGKSIGDHLTRMIRHSFWRRILRALKRHEQMAKLKAMKAKHHRAEEAIRKKYERLSWRKWLEIQAQNGSRDALEAIRARGTVRTAANTIYVDRHTNSSDIVKVTRKGSRIFSDGSKENRGQWMFNRFLTANTAQKETVKEQLRAFFTKNPDSKIKVTGSRHFVDAVIEVAKEMQITPRFEQPELAQRMKRQPEQNTRSEYRGR